MFGKMRDGLFGWALDLPSKVHRQPQFRRGRNWGESSLELIGWRGKEEIWEAERRKPRLLWEKSLGRNRFIAGTASE